MIFRSRRSSGFTLIELITVITIIGVLAVVDGPRFASSDVYEERTFLDDLSAALQYARAKAAGSGCITQVDFTSSGFTVSVDSDCNSSNGFAATAVTNPGDYTTGFSERAPLPSGSSYVATVDPILFDGRGRAMNSALNVLSAAAQVTVGGTVITVEGATGYVH